MATRGTLPHGIKDLTTDLASSGKTFVYGIHPVTEALDSGKNLDRIVVSRDGKNEG